MMEFGEFLKSKRMAKKMTIRQLALYAGCSDSYLSLLERGAGGARTPTPGFLRKLSAPLGVPYEVLMAAAGYLLQTEGEVLCSGSVVMVLRTSLGDDVEEFARRVGCSTYEIQTFEEHGISYEALQTILTSLFRRQRLMSLQQKELLFRMEETFHNLPSQEFLRFATVFHAVLDLMNEQKPMES